MIYALITYEIVESWLEAHQTMFGTKRKEIEQKLCMLEKERKTRYDTLKRNLRYVYQALKECEDLSDVDMQRLVDLIVDQKSNFNQEYLAITQKEQSKKWKDWILRKVGSYAGAVQGSASNNLPSLPHMDDVEFCKHLEQLVNDIPHLQDAAKEIRSETLAILEQKIKQLVKIVDDIGELLKEEMEVTIKQAYSERDKTELKNAWDHLLQEVNLHLKTEPHQNG
jgi:hypothetical protein